MKTGQTQTRTPLAHESAALHVTGQARYVDDMALPANSVHIALGLSQVAHGRINSIEIDAALSAPGFMLFCAQVIFPGVMTAAR